MRTSFIVFLVITFFSYALHSEELADGKLYTGPAAIEVGPAGLAFVLPKGWVGKLVGEEFLAQHGAESAIISVNVSKFTKQEALKRMSSPVTLDAGIVLTPTKKPTVNGNKLFVPATISMPEGSLNSEVRVIVGKHEFGVTLIGFGKTKANLKAMQKALKALEKSVKLSKPKAAKSSGYWGEYLAGKSLTQWDNKTSGQIGNGSSSQTRYTFCPNGTFSYYSSESFQNTTAGVGSVSGASNGSNFGTWTASGAKGNGKVNLTWKNGSKDTAILSVGPKGELLVNGSRWLRKTISCD